MLLFVAIAPALSGSAIRSLFHDERSCAMCRLQEPGRFRESRLCSRFSRFSALRKYRGLSTFVSSDKAAKELSPTSIPTAVSAAGFGSGTFTLMLTIHWSVGRFALFFSPVVQLPTQVQRSIHVLLLPGCRVQVKRETEKSFAQTSTFHGNIYSHYNTTTSDIHPAL